MRNPISLYSIYTYFTLILLATAVAIRGGMAIRDLSPDDNQHPQAYSIGNIQSVFPDASSYSKDSRNEINVLNKQGRVLGHLLCSSDFGISNTGYAGEIPLFIILDQKQHVTGIHLLDNQESEEYIDYLKEKKLLQQWNGLAIDSTLVKLPVDAVSGATYSSDALIKTVRETASAYLEIQNEAIAINWLSAIRLLLTLILLGISLLMVIQNKLKKGYWFYLLLVFIVPGLWFKQMLSVDLLHNWLTHGIPTRTNIELLVILLLSIAMSVLGYRKYYCNYLCAMGAVQLLAAKISPFKKRSFNLKISVVSLRTLYLTFIWVSLLLGFSLPLTYMEPFMAFSFTVVSVFMLIAGVAIVVLSLFFNRPWCQLCPTGCLLDAVPSIQTKNKNRNEK